MKKKIKLLKLVSVIIIFLITFLSLAVMIEIKYGPNLSISREIEIKIPLFAKVDYHANHGGITMDVEALGIVYLTEEQAKNVLNQIKSNEHWRKLPMTDRALESAREHCIKESMIMPIVENGYWFYLDRYSEAINKYDENERYEKIRYSKNYSIAVLDTDKNILYYYELDT